MAEARNRQLWAHTSEVLALIANCHAKRRYSAADFNPTLPRRVVPASAGLVGELLGRM